MLVLLFVPERVSGNETNLICRRQSSL